MKRMLLCAAAAALLSLPSLPASAIDDEPTDLGRAIVLGMSDEAAGNFVSVVRAWQHACVRPVYVGPCESERCIVMVICENDRPFRIRREGELFFPEGLED